MPIINTPDGQVQFPDSMSDQEIKAVLAQKYGAPAKQQPITPDASTQPQESRGYATTQLLDDIGAGLRRGANQLAVGAQQAYDALPSMNPFPLSDRAKALQQSAVGIDVLTGKPLEQRAAELRRTENTPTVNYLAAGIPELLLGAPAKTLKGAIGLNSLLGALQPTTKGESRAENAAFSGAATAATGLVGNVLGKAIDSAIGTRNLLKKDIPTSEQVRNNASNIYDEASGIAPSLTQDFVDDFIKKISGKLQTFQPLESTVANESDVVATILQNLRNLKKVEKPQRVPKSTARKNKIVDAEFQDLADAYVYNPPAYSGGYSPSTQIVGDATKLLEQQAPQITSNVANPIPLPRNSNSVSLQSLGNKGSIVPKTNSQNGLVVQPTKNVAQQGYTDFKEVPPQSYKFSDIIGFDQRLTKRLKDYVLPNGKLNSVGSDLKTIRDDFRKALNSAPPEQILGDAKGFEIYKKATAEWSKSLKLGDIERILKRGVVNGDNPVTAIKAGFRTMANNPKKMNAFTEAERAAIVKAANSSPTVDALKTLGSRLIPIGNAVSGGGAGGFIASKVGGDIAREGAAFGQGLRAKNVLATINNNGQALPDSKTAEIARRLGYMTGGALNRSQSQEGQ